MDRTQLYSILLSIFFILSNYPLGFHCFGPFQEYSRILPSFNIRQHDVVNNDEVIDIKNEIALDDQAFGYEDDDDYGSRSAIPPGSIFASHGKRIKDGGPTKNQIKNQWVVEGDGKLRNVGRRPRRHQRRPKLPKLPYPYIAVPYPIPIAIPYPLTLPVKQRNPHHYSK